MPSSGCSQCFVGLPCKKHPRGDGGALASQLKEKLGNRAESLKKLYETVVKPQVARLEASQGLGKGLSAREQDKYREHQERARTKAEKRGNKLTPEQRERAKELKLGGHLLGMMLHSSSDGNSSEGEADHQERKRKKKKRKRSSSSSSSESDSSDSSSSSRDRKRKRKVKKKSSKKKEKKSRKDSKKSRRKEPRTKR